MNPITPELTKGSIGELLVQLRLLQFGVQAAPPIKDSGNDLIAVCGNVFKAIQVKTVTTESYSIQGLPEFYHILAVVQLVCEGANIFLDQSKVHLIPKASVSNAPRTINRIGRFVLTPSLVESLFPQTGEQSCGSF